MKKKVAVAALLTVLCTCPFDMCVFADDNLGESTDTTAAQGAYRPAEKFDRQLGMYKQIMGNGMEFLSSVPNGASVSDAVYFNIPSNISVTLQRDGQIVDYINKTPIYNAGYYIMRLNSTDYTTGNTVINVFMFRISTPPKKGESIKGYSYPRITCSAAVTADGDLYKYTMPNYKAFYSTVPSYGATVESAAFELPVNVGYTLKRNGNVIPLLNNKVYSEPGSYTLTILANSYAATGGYAASFVTALHFTVPSAQTQEETDELALEEKELFGEDISEAVEQPADAEISQPKEPISDMLIENYFESAAIYSETFSTGDAFYTNTPNDGIVGGRVYLDIPYNMSVSMTKDGSAAAFVNKTYINEPGSYTMLVSNVSGEDVYTARFSFRIQNGVEQAAEVSGASNGIKVPVAGKTVNSEKNEEKVPVVVDVKGFDTASGMYCTELGDKTVYSSVPNGMFSNVPVELKIPDDVTALLEKDGEKTELADNIAEDGRYLLKLTDEAGNKGELSFDIASYACNYMTEFKAPDGYTLISVEYTDYNGTYETEDKELTEKFNEGMARIEEQQLSLADSFILPLDGQYTFIMLGEEGLPSLSTVVVLDTTAPKVTFEGLDENMHTDGESAVVYCDDAEATITDADGNEIALENGSGIINGKGEISLFATDPAGNVSEYKLTLGSGGFSAFGAVKGAVVAALIFCYFIVSLIVITILKVFETGKNTDKKPAEKKRDKKTETPETQVPADDWESTDISYNNSETTNAETDDWESF